MRKIVKRIMSLCTVMILLLPTVAFAESNQTLKVGNQSIDIEALAKENGVSPHELEQAIIEGMYADRSSPFSDLVSIRPKEPEYGETIMGKTPGVGVATKSNQDSTAYVDSSGALTASRKTPEIGMCAMHVNATTKTGSETSNKVKLGQTIYMLTNINMSGTWYRSFIVEDRGAPKNRTTYWIDIYFGEKNDASYNAAIDYGVQTVDFKYYY